MSNIEHSDEHGDYYDALPLDQRMEVLRYQADEQHIGDWAAEVALMQQQLRGAVTLLGRLYGYAADDRLPPSTLLAEVRALLEPSTPNRGQ